jgi:hypothetical protein
MARLSLLLLALAAFATPAVQGVAQGALPPAAERDVEVRRLSPALVEAEPGEIVTLSFRVENRSPDPLLFQEILELPEGWTPLFLPAEFALASGESTVRLVGVQPGALAPGGEQDVRYGVVGLSDPTVRGEAEATVQLREVYALEMVGVGESVLRLFAGEVTEFGVRVLNRGNTPLEVQVGARLDLPAQIEVVPATVSLEPGGSELIRLRITTDPRLEDAQRRTLTVTASTPHEVAGRPVGARISVAVEGVPLRAGGDSWLRFPVTLSAFGVDDGSRSATQFTVFGDGFLDEARRRRLQLFVRGPDREGRAILNQRDEVWGVLELPWLVLSAGDRAFTLSELSAQSRYGRGGGVELRPAWAPVALSAFHVEDRFQVRERTDRGGSVAFGSGQLRLNYLEMSWEPMEEEPSYREQVATLEARWNAGAALRLDGEAARSESTRGDGVAGEAWRLSATGRLGTAWDYRIRGRWAGPDFAGRLFDAADYEAHLGFPLGLGVRGTVGAQRYERNLDAVPSRGTANRENLFRGGVSIPLPAQLRLSLDLDVYDRDDARADVGRRIEQERVRVGVSQTRGAFSYRAEVRYSEARDRVEETTSSGLNYNLSLNYRPSRTFSLNGQARFGRDDTPRDSRLGRETSDYAGSLLWQPWEALRFRASYSQRQQRFPDDPIRERQDQEFYSAGFDFSLSRTQEFRGDVRRSESRFGIPQTVLSLAYQLRLDLPYARRGSVGALSGEARLLGPEGEIPLANALVRVGGTATRTDAQGRFHFRTLAQGEHVISVETSDFGAGIVAASGQPDRVLIHGGGRGAEARLLYLEGATVRGTLRVIEPDATPGTILPLPIPPAGGATGGSGGSGGNRANNGKDGDGGNLEGARDGFPEIPGRDGSGLAASAPLAPPPSPESRALLGGILVELAQGDDIRRTLTDRDGNFRFQLLPPGTWTLRVYPQGLPAFHQLDRESQELRVVPGEEQVVTVRILPMERRIRFLDEGETLTAPSTIDPGARGAPAGFPGARGSEGRDR